LNFSNTSWPEPDLICTVRNDAAINPGAEENFTDGIDNDSDNLIDAQAPDAVGCPVTCTDADADTYSVEGGECGVVDSNDSNAAVNPVQQKSVQVQLMMIVIAKLTKQLNHFAQNAYQTNRVFLSLPIVHVNVLYTGLTQCIHPHAWQCGIFCTL